MTTAHNSSRLHWLPFIVAATFFMEYLDTTIIATALPQMAQSFKIGPNELSLGMTAYMLTLAVFIPISGLVRERSSLGQLWFSPWHRSCVESQVTCLNSPRPGFYRVWVVL